MLRLTMYYDAPARGSRWSIKQRTVPYCFDVIGHPKDDRWIVECVEVTPQLPKEHESRKQLRQALVNTLKSWTGKSAVTMMHPDNFIEVEELQ